MELSARGVAERIVSLVPEQAWERFVTPDGRDARLGTPDRWIVHLVQGDGVELSARRRRERRDERLVRRLHNEAELAALIPALRDLMIWWSARLTLHSLVPGRAYRVGKRVLDVRGHTFSAGQELVFVEKHYLPHDGGNTLVFRRPDGVEERIYLQDDEQREILEDFDAYVVHDSPLSTKVNT